jgi:uncharacterized protein (DUF433 family)
MAAITKRELRPRIVKDPRIHGGEPIVEGTRVPVRSVVILLEQHGDPARVYAGLPTLPPGGVEAALAYYEADRDEVERYVAEMEAEAGA